MNNNNHFVKNKLVFCQCCLQACHVVYTDFRPTPLQHYIYPAGGDGLFLVEDEKVQTEVVFLDFEFFATHGLVTLFKLS